MSNVAVMSLVGWALLSPARLASAEPVTPAPKSRGVATLLSLGGTLAPVGLIALGARSGNDPLAAAGVVSALIAPSAGEFYAGEVSAIGMGIRAVGIGASLMSYQMTLGCVGRGGPCSEPILAFLVTGLFGYTAGALYDIASAGPAVDRHNQRLQLQIAPVVPTASGPAPGLVVGGSF